MWKQTHEKKKEGTKNRRKNTPTHCAYTLLPLSWTLPVPYENSLEIPVFIYRRGGGGGGKVGFGAKQGEI